MDKQTAQKIRLAADEALQAIAEDLGVQITIKNGTFDGGQVTYKVEFAEVGEDGNVATKEAEDFKAYAFRYGMKPEHLGAEFDAHGDRFRIVGCKPRATKMPILAENAAGKRYKFNDRDVCRFLGIEQPEPTVSDFQPRG